MKSILEEIKVVKKSLRSSAEIRAEIQSFPRWQRLLRLNLIAARNRAEELRQAVVLYSLQSNTHLDIANGADQNHVENAAGTFSNSMSITNLFAPLASCEAVLKILEGDQQHQAAYQKIQPLQDELIEAENREALLRAEANQAANELEAAKETARAEMESKIDDHPAVVEAQRKLEPFRRLGEVIV